MRKIIVLLMLMGYWRLNVFAQEDFRMGVILSPQLNWIKTNDKLVNQNGLQAALLFGLVGEISLNDHFALGLGLNYTFNKGGKLLYDKGGNYLPKSDLSNPKLNTGDKPLPDLTEIRYSFKSLEIPVSLKIRTDDSGLFRYFLEWPILRWGFVTQARGDLKGVGIRNAEDENINKDTYRYQIDWGAGAGLEFDMNNYNTLILGIQYTKSLNDVTRNNGHRALNLTSNNNTPDPSDDTYAKEKDVSKARVGVLALRLALLF